MGAVMVAGALHKAGLRSYVGGVAGEVDTS